jgi:hypothetical protein
MLNKNSKILLTVSCGGELGTPVSYKSTKEVVSKVKTSPFESQSVDVKGNPTGMYLTPKGHYLASNDFKARKPQDCTRSINISGSAVVHFISDEYPSGIKKSVWLGMNQESRILYHLTQFADGNKFTFEVIE